VDESKEERDEGENQPPRCTGGRGWVGGICMSLLVFVLYGTDKDVVVAQNHN
jgi:hypothetical protein